MGSIEELVEAINSRNPEEEFSYTKFASANQVDRSTLARRHQGVSTSREVKALNQRKLNNTEEAALIRLINSLTEQGLPPNRLQIRNYAAKLAGNSVSNS